MVTARGNIDDSSGLMVIVCRLKVNDAGLLCKHTRLYIQTYNFVFVCRKC